MQEKCTHKSWSCCLRLTFCIAVGLKIWTTLLVLHTIRVAATPSSPLEGLSTPALTRVFCCTQNQQLSTKHTHTFTLHHMKYIQHWNVTLNVLLKYGFEALVLYWSISISCQCIPPFHYISTTTEYWVFYFATSILHCGYWRKLEKHHLFAKYSTCAFWASWEKKECNQ